MSYGPEVSAVMIPHRPWIALVTCAAIAISLLGRLYLSKSRPDQKALSAAEDEVYEAVVRDMVTPTHGQANISQLVFDDTVLTGLMIGADVNACKESVRTTQLPLEGDTPPFNSLADKFYRFLTRLWSDGSSRAETIPWSDGSLRAETIQDFLKESCTEGPLSRTFHTDFPRVFVKRDSVLSDIVPNQKDGRKDFRQTFPGASGIISLSHVGFDSTLREAIVSTLFISGDLYGTDWRCILRKKRGRWEVARKSVVFKGPIIFGIGLKNQNSPFTNEQAGCGRMVKNLKRIEKAWFPVSQFSRTAGF